MAGLKYFRKFYRLPCERNLYHSGNLYIPIRYQAASPDEGALVDAARNIGFNFHTRNPKDIVCDIRGVPTRYEILAILEFNR